MGNVSQQKRRAMLEILAHWEAALTDDEARGKLREIAGALDCKKFGLVWEEHRERADEELEQGIPVFQPVPERELVREPGGPCHFLLEGDNLHSLSLLQKTHRERVDLIYIDPPYNRGKDDFVYDDNYVEAEDSFRHSKWLSFMEKRLRLAYDLLAADGILFMSIDDKEQAPLKLLADEIFGEQNFVITLPRVTKRSGKTTGSFSKNHDYVLVYTKGNGAVFAMEEHTDPEFRYEDEYVAQRGRYKLNQTLDYDSLSYSASLDYPLELEGETFYPGSDAEKYRERQAGRHKRADWAWRWGRELVDFGYRNGFIVIRRRADGSARIYTKTYLNAKIEKNKQTGAYEVVQVKRTKALSSLGLTENRFSNDNAKKDLAAFGLADSFDYSKPVELVRQLLRCHGNKNAVVLDFFAGSGTTAQAVLEQNAADGGHRTFLLATNNQNGICEHVTYARVQALLGAQPFAETVEEVLWERPVTLALFKNATETLAELEEVKQLRKGEFDSLKTEVREGSLTLLGRNKLVRTGFPGNVLYYRVGFVPRGAEEGAETALFAHTLPLIWLEQGRKTGAETVLLASDEEADAFFADPERVAACRALYVSARVLLTAKQEETLEQTGLPVFAVPDRYFEAELRKEGER